MSRRRASSTRASSALPARTRLSSALEALARTDRLVLSLLLLEGLSSLEIAGVLQLTTREVEERRVAALTTVTRELGEPTAERRAA